MYDGFYGPTSITKQEYEIQSKIRNVQFFYLFLHVIEYFEARHSYPGPNARSPLRRTTWLLYMSIYIYIYVKK